MPSRYWLLTRKYPPSVGGMETLSFELTSGLSRRLPVHLLALRRSQRWLPWFVLSSAMRLVAGLLRREVRVVHLGDPVLAPLGWIARRAGIPVVMVVHGLDVSWPNPLYQWMLRRFARGFDRYVCISAAARRAAQAAGFAVDRLVVVPVGARRPTGPVAAAPAPMLGEGPWLLQVGRIVPRKGLAWFIANVMPGLRHRFPTAHLAVVGSGPGEAAARQAAVACGVAEAVVFLGAVDEPTKWACLDAADLCVMPNIAVPGDLEGFGIAALEAGLAAKPLVASAVDGLLDAVTDGVNGRLAEAGSPSAWLAVIGDLLADPAERARLGARARVEVAARFSWDAIVDRHVEILGQAEAGAR